MLREDSAELEKLKVTGIEAFGDKELEAFFGDEVEVLLLGWSWVVVG